MEHVAANPDIELDVQFKINRLHYVRKHQAVDRCVENDILTSLFPENCVINNYNTTPIHAISNEKYLCAPEMKHFNSILFFYHFRFVNKDILNNPEQKTAVTNIVNNSSGRAPYIVFGPPGTGKTVTIVESIVQVRNLREHRNAAYLINDTFRSKTLKEMSTF